MTEENKESAKKDSTFKYYTIIISVLTLLLIASIFTQGFGTLSGAYIAKDAAGKATIDFVNTQLQGQATATLVGVEDSNSVYSVNLTIDEEPLTVYISKDGKYLFPSAIPMIKAAQTPAASEFDATDSEKPVVEFFVMSFCPYGIQAEKALAPVYELLKDTVIFEPHFIVSVNNGTLQSLHGEAEGLEDMRQAVIYKYYPEKFWGYLNYVNSKCDLKTIGTCWEDAAESVSLEVALIEEYVENEGMTLMEAEMKKTEQYGVRGSPTIIINGDTYSGGRTADAYKSGICTGFGKAPSECDTVLSDEATTSSGSC